MSTIKKIQYDAETVIGDAIVEFEAMDWVVADDECHSDLSYEQKSVFLGTVFNLMPSGKYYTPWANSNVEPCPKCEGDGVLKTDHPQNVIHGVTAMQSTFRALVIATFGYFGNGKWPAEANAVSDAMNVMSEKFSETNECEDCGGLGSVEAYHDQVWTEKAEEVAESHNCYLDAGEGDPCDLFLIRSREVKS